MLYNMKLLLRSENDEVFHTLWFININQKTVTTVQTYFCQSRAVVIIFGSHVKFLVLNLILRNCVLHIFPMK